mgnify:CR=1 FL=1
MPEEFATYIESHIHINELIPQAQTNPAALAVATDSSRYDFLLRHRGMFSLIGTSAQQAQRLRQEHGIYIVADGRINVAGLNEAQIEPFVAALMAVR